MVKKMSKPYHAIPCVSRLLLFFIRLVVCIHWPDINHMHTFCTKRGGKGEGREREREGGREEVGGEVF